MAGAPKGRDLESIVYSLWMNWVVSTGVIVLPVLLSLWLPAAWLPIIALTLMLVMLFYSSSAFARGACICYQLSEIASRTLLFSAIIMEVILLANSHGWLYNYFEEGELNDNLPFIAVLIVAPVTLVVGMYYKIRGFRSNICRKCVRVFGTAVERGFVGHLLVEESEYQLKFHAIISGAITVLTIIYYYFIYINVNINSADGFYFCWMPAILWLAAVVYMTARYASLVTYYERDVEGGYKREGRKTWVRFLVMNDDFIYLTHKTEDYDIPGKNKIDTPASLKTTYAEHLPMPKVSDIFENLSGLKVNDFALRFMYLSREAEGMSNIFHFIVTVKDKEVIDSSSLEGTWYSISQLQRLLFNRDLSPILASEINRLYHVAMAWKTYDRDGNRLYKIKNYRPMFRLRGIADWDVDFNDIHWLDVARFNQDKPFFRIRRWLKRLSGEYKA
ncbi:MAG: hypothetical protein NC098_03665 [Lachnoclostridium sp.]|nr:hypothetical protein [Lachnoclostridium sp.]